MKTSAPRYQVRFSNGYWKSFDTATYRTVAVHVLVKDAGSYVTHLNTRDVK